MRSADHTSSLFTRAAARLSKALLPALLLFAPAAFASHIAGGEITYECIGNNQYRIKFTFFRDCSGISLPSSVNIDVYNASQTRVQRVNLPLVNSTRVDGVSPSPCTVVPAVCMIVGEFEGIATLPPSPGGYRLAFDLCCRNSGIVNGPTGNAAYTTTIPDISLATCNNSAVFRDWPPVFLCLGEAFTFDHSATDADGDSLVYSLCTPYERIVPSTPYPFGAGYSATNPMGGNALGIDPVTGLLSVTPTRLGRHVVGVCVSEYRNGVLINTSTRDFQLNVVNCVQLTTAAGLGVLTNCATREVTFFNTSNNGSTFLWNFGDGATSTAANPVHLYPGLGNYTATLIAYNASNPQCNDTTTIPVNVTECRACGMSVQVNTTPGICNRINGCYQIQYTHPCASSMSVSYPGVSITSSSSGSCVGGGSITGGTAPSFNDITVTMDGATLPTAATTVTMTYLGPPGSCTNSVVGSSTATHSIVTFNAVYTDPQPGGATAVITGGTPPYTVRWTTTPMQTGNPATSVEPGSYSVIVTDANGCTEVVPFTVAGASSMQATASSTNLSACGANNGTLGVTVSGNTGPVTYRWTPGNYTTANVNNVPPGTYTVLITDDSCSISRTVTVLDAANVQVTASTNQILCPTDNNGSATVTSTTGGQGPYTYSWNTTPPQTGNTATNLPFGFYTVRATDQNGCTGTFSFSMTGPTAMQHTISSVDPVCAHGFGSATVSATGGTTPYQYSWNTTPPQTGATANNLLGDRTYTVTIRDANNCTRVDSVRIVEPPHIHIDLHDQSTVTCGGIFNGSIFADVVGGSSTRYITDTLYKEPFNTDFLEVGCGSWHADVSGAGPTNLMNNTYAFRTIGGQFVARRVAGEVVWYSRVIDISNETSVDLNGDFYECGGMTSPTHYIRAYYRLDNGFEVLWFDQTGNAPVDCSLLPGSVTGLSGSTLQIIIRVMNPNSTGREHRFDNIRVTGDVSGVLYDATFDTPNQWADPNCEWWRDVKGPGVMTQISGAGTANHVETRNGVMRFTDTDGEVVWYSRTVDISGCASVAISADFGFIGAHTTTKYIRGFYSIDGGPEVQWANHTGNNAAGWPNGNPCTDELTGLTGNTLRIIVRVNSTATADIHTLDNVKIICTRENPNPYSYSWTCTGQTTPTVTGIAPGLCMITVTDSLGCSEQATITLANPGVMAVSAVPTSACGGTSDGTATAQVTGGNVPYTYAWSCSPMTTQAVSGLAAGTNCTVTVTDSQGCTSSAALSIPADPALGVDTVSVIPDCAGDGAIDLQVVGGTPGFVYFWSHGASTRDVSGLTGPDTYTVSVWDANNCFDTLSVFVDFHCSTLPIALTGFDVLCRGGPRELSWTTASESNNARFDVERSADGVRFVAIGTLPGAGNSASPRQYRYVDDEPVRGTVYYRLRQTDFDGRWSFGPLRAADCPVPGGITIFPNPYRDTFTIRMGPGLDGRARISITDQAGRLVYERNVGGREELMGLPVGEGLAPGAYHVRVEHGTGAYVQRLVKMQ